METKIVRFDQINGQVFVEYSANGVSVTQAIDVPILDGQFLSGDALTSLVMAHVPTVTLTRLAELAAADATGIVALVVKTPDQIRQERVTEINIARDAKLKNGMEHLGTTFPCDAVFQQQLTSFIVAWETGILPQNQTVAVRTFHDSILQMSYIDVKALAAAVMSYVQTVYAESWTAKDAL